MITTLASNIPYSQRKREAVARAIPHVAVGAADAYVATAVLQGLGGQAAAGTFGVLSGGLAAVHAGRGIWNLMMASNQDNDYNKSRSPIEKKRFQAMAIGEFITGVGFAGMTFGLGMWALPVVALGEVTTNFARFT